MGKLSELRTRLEAEMADRPYQVMAIYQLESGRSVTYAAYRWACKNLQDVLDRKKRETARQRQTRTEELPSTEPQKDVQASLGAGTDRAGLFNAWSRGTLPSMAQRAQGKRYCQELCANLVCSLLLNEVSQQ